MPTNLESFHAPLTDAFPRLQGRRDRDGLRLSPEQVSDFERDGFVFGLPLLGREQVEALRSSLAGIGERLEELAPSLHEVERGWLERPDEVVLHFLGAWLVDELFHDLVFHPGATVPAAQLLGLERLRFWHDQVFWKPAGHRGVVPWHQDYSYWTRTAPAKHITVFLALDEMAPDNGCLEYVPGSQRWGLLPAIAFDGPREQVLVALSDEQRETFQSVPVHLKAGQIAIHHSHTLHGSGPNPSERPRRAVVLNYMAPDTRCADGSRPLLLHAPPVAAGSVVDGAHFPLVLT